MAIDDIKNKASSAYNTSLDIGGKVYKASEPYRATGKSVIAAARGNLFEFPVFISSSVQLDYATATSSLLEQVYASYLQAALSLDPIVDSSLVRNKTPFAKFQSDTNRYVEYTDMDYAHDAVHNEFILEDGNTLEFDLMSIEDQDGKVIVEYFNKRPLSEFDHYFMEQNSGPSKKDWAAFYKARQDFLDEKTAFDVYAKDVRDLDKESTKRLDEATKKLNKALDIKNDVNSMIDFEKQRRALEAAQKALDDAKKKNDIDQKTLNLNRDKFEYQKQHDKDTEKFEREKFEHQKTKDQNAEDRANRQEKRDEIDANFKHAIKVPELLDETKIKKLNTMKPLMMNVNFHVMDDKGTISEPVNYVVAVKTYNRIIDADTLPEVAEYPLKEMNKIARKAKWRAGELKFFRDIVFKVKQKKQTAVDSRDPKRKWYRRLYELAHMTGDAPTKAAIKGKNITWSVVKSQIENDFDFGVIPNSTLVISNEDVINVKAKTGIDLLNGGTATKFCKELFLIGMVVIDTNAESIKILLPDNHDDYEVHSLASVNKQLAELSTAGSKTRDIFKLLG